MRKGSISFGMQVNSQLAKTAALGRILFSEGETYR
jgi:hypothetical protein